MIRIALFGLMAVGLTASAADAAGDGDPRPPERAFCFSADAAEPGGRHDHAATREQPLNKGTHRYREIQPGETFTLMDVDGPGRIESMWFATVLEGRIRIWWDGAREPAVDAPLADFFFFAYPDLPFGEDGEFAMIDSERVMVAPYRGLNCWWRMPFRRHCRIEVTSHERNPERLYHCISGVYAPVAETELYFHARSVVSEPVAEGLHEALATEGSGRFVGLAMGIAAPLERGDEFHDCFCEGPMKVYIDGEETPTYGYTGIEDYFGGSYGWGRFASVAAAQRKYRSFSGRYIGFRALPVAPGETKARYRLYRIHEHDPIPFARSFRLVIPSFAINSALPPPSRFVPRHDDFRTVAFWYALQGKSQAE